MLFVWFDLFSFILINLSFLCMCFSCAFSRFYHVYYYWIFGSPRPTVCKSVIFHSQSASELQLWNFPLASMHLHFFVWKQLKLAHVTSYQVSLALANCGLRTTSHLCLKRSIACPGTKRRLTNAKLVTRIQATKSHRRAAVRLPTSLFLCAPLHNVGLCPYATSSSYALLWLCPQRHVKVYQQVQAVLRHVKCECFFVPLCVLEW